MNLGFASPVSLQLLRHLVSNEEDLPPGYQFAPSAAWIQELIKRGHHVTLYTTAREIDAPKTFRGEGITIRIARQRPHGTGRDFFAAERKQLQQMMASDRCQIIHAHWTYQFALAALSSGIPTLTTIHDLPWRVLGYFQDLHRVSRLLMAYEVAARGKHFTAVSQDAAVHFHRYFNPRAEITVIPNGLPDSIFALGMQSSRCNSKEIKFATVLQGWSRQKNATTALRAFQIVRNKAPEAKLLMFGHDYEQNGKAYEWAVRHNLDANVTFVGLLPNDILLKRIRDEVDIVVHPSLNESFSMTALEAMALLKPVIAGAETSGVREVLGFGESGVLVDVSNPKAIAEQMLRLAEDATYRDRIAESGFARASSLYRLGTVAQQYESLYKQLSRN